MSKPNSQTNQKMTNDKFWQFRNLAGDDQKAELLLCLLYTSPSPRDTR